MHPDDNTRDDLIRRGDVIDALKRIADDHENMALFGETEQARVREAMASALRRAQYAVAFMPKGSVYSTEADLFWDDADTESSYTDIADITDHYAEGEIICIKRATILPVVFAVRVGDDTDSFDTPEEAEAWAKAHGMTDVS